MKKLVYPITGGKGGGSPMIDEPAGNRSYLPTRRIFLKTGLIGLAFLTELGACLSLLEAHSLPEDWAVDLPTGVILADPGLCSGCRTCEAVCSVFNNEGRAASELARIILEKDYLNGVYEPNTCYQCLKPLCLHACPVEAIIIDEASGTKARIIDQDSCIGCGKCIEACGRIFTPPRPRYDAELEQTQKCDLCSGDPQCVKHCPYGALRFERSLEGIESGYPLIREG